MTYTYGSLFTGIGGFDLGFDRAGFEPAFMCEMDRHARAVLDHHWPTVTKYTDVKDLANGNPTPPTVDVLTGGFPCQDVSVAGKRAGLAGKRSGLWFAFKAILENTRPEWVVIENVPGLLSSNKGRDFAVILRGLAECGYGVAYRVLDSQYFGVAQRRRRVFIVGHLGDGRAAEVLFERESLSGNIETGRKAGQAVANGTGESIAGTVSSKWRKGVGGPAGDERYNQVVSLPLFVSGGSEDGTRRHHLVVVHGISKLSNINANGRRTKPGDGVSFTLEASSSSNQAVVYENHGNDSRVTESGDISPTLKKQMGTGGNNTPIVEEKAKVRRLTPVECERLQGFPDHWTAMCSDSQRYKQLGNAVTVNVAEWIARRIMKSMGIS